MQVTGCKVIEVFLNLINAVYLGKSLVLPYALSPFKFDGGLNLTH